MKNLFIIFCILPLFTLAQNYDYIDGAKYLKQAEKHLSKSNIEKAQYSINEAKKCSWGFCGNAHASAESRIYLLQSDVYQLQGEYQKALAVLDSIWGCEYGAACIKSDSIKIELLFKIYGEQKVKLAFSNVLNDFVGKDSIPLYLSKSILIPELNYTFNFYVPWSTKRYVRMPTFAMLTEDLSYSKLLNLP